MGILGSLFGRKEEKKMGKVDLVASLLEQLVERADFKLSFDVTETPEGDVSVEFFGEDEELLIQREAALLDSFQLFLKRAAQHQLPEFRGNVHVDCDGYRAALSRSLIDLAEKLKAVAVEKGKPVYIRALSPRDRKVVHQYLAEDARVKSRSVGDGLYKKIKIFPIQGEQRVTASRDVSSGETLSETAP